MTKSKRFSYPSNLDLDDQLAYGVGSLIMHWASLETLFYGLLECLAGRSETDNGRVIWLSLRTTEARMALISQLSKVQDLGQVEAAEVQKACDRFKGISGVRNYYCHSYYQADLSGSVVQIVNLKLSPSDNPVSQQTKPVSKATLNEIADTIERSMDLNVEVWRLLVRVRAALPSGQHLSLPSELDEYLANEGRPPRPKTA